MGVCFQNLVIFDYMYMCTYLKKTRMKARMDTRRTVADKPTASPIIVEGERPGGGGVVGVDENEGRGVVMEGVGREGVVVRGISMTNTVDEGEGIAKGG